MEEDWRERAACRGENPELFFPVGTSGPALQQIEQAKAICRSCPVARECLAAALENGEDAGIWGGLTAEERRIVRHARARRLARLGAVRRQLRGGSGAEGELEDAEITDLPTEVWSAASHTDWARRTSPVPLPRQEPSAPRERRA